MGRRKFKDGVHPDDRVKIFDMVREPIWYNRISIFREPDHLTKLYVKRQIKVVHRPATLGDFSLLELQEMITKVIQNPFKKDHTFVFPSGRFYLTVLPPDPDDDKLVQEKTENPS